MKRILLMLCLIVLSSAVYAQSTAQETSKVLKNKTVEIACGECKFDMKGKSCDLAIRIDGTSYFVDGKNIDDFGDAHDKKKGFCNVISKATVTGEIVNNRFKADKIELVNAKKGVKKKY